MARAFQCDRCMRYYTANKEIPAGSTDSFLTGIQYLKNEKAAYRSFELCDECLKKIVDYMNFKTDAPGES